MVRPGGGGFPGARARTCYIRAENMDRAGPLYGGACGGRDIPDCLRMAECLLGFPLLRFYCLFGHN